MIAKLYCFLFQYLCKCAEIAYYDSKGGTEGVVAHSNNPNDLIDSSAISLYNISGSLYSTVLADDVESCSGISLARQNMVFMSSGKE